MHRRSAFAVLGALAVLVSCTSPRGAAEVRTSSPAEGARAHVGDAGASDAADARARSPSALSLLDARGACALDVVARAAVHAGAKPFTRADGECKDQMCDVAEVPPRGADACFVATPNIARAERSARAVGPSGPAASTPWDKKRKPKFWDRVDGHLHLGDREQELLRQNGFVVLDRETYDSYAVAFHDVFQQQLPVYIGVDAIYNAIYQSSQSLLGEVEDKQLGPALGGILDRLRATLAASGRRYDPESVADLQVYLGVAFRLLHANAQPAPLPDPAIESQVESLTAQAKEGEGLAEVELFGRSRIIDDSQFKPRGRYANNAYGDGFDIGQEHIAPSDYFQAMMWLSRVELNVVSRSCRSSQPGATSDSRETPREARDALALADLVARSGELADLQLFEDTYSVFAGHREDLPLPTIAALAAKKHIGVRDAEAQTKLAAAIGNGFQRTARTHFMPEDATTLPVITTMFGPRIVPDIAPLTELVHPAINDRFELSAADVGFVLGHDRAKKYLGDDLRKFPALQGVLDASRAAVNTKNKGAHDVYGAWLDATSKLADSPSGVTPSFMRTEAYADLRLDSALAAYAQIRHTFVLLAGQGYDAYGCEIPDGYVEPAVAAYDALLVWVAAARRAAPTRSAYFSRVTEILSTLKSIAATELAGRPLTEPQRRWLGMVAEYTPKDGSNGDSGEPPKYTGWYFDLFPDREQGAERSVQLVADYFTLTNADEVRHLGIRQASLGVFVVDTSGEPRVMVGPVANAYEVTTPIAGRLDDEAAKDSPDKRAPWQASYLAPERAEPDIAARAFACPDGMRVVVQGGNELAVSVTVLDHHGDPLASPVTHAVSTEPTAFLVTMPDTLRDSARGAEGLHLAVHRGTEHWDFVSSPNVYFTPDGPLPNAGPGSRFDMAFGALRPSAPPR